MGLLWKAELHCHLLICTTTRHVHHHRRNRVVWQKYTLGLVAAPLWLFKRWHPGRFIQRVGGAPGPYHSPLGAKLCHYKFENRTRLASLFETTVCAGRRCRWTPARPVEAVSQGSIVSTHFVSSLHLNVNDTKKQLIQLFVIRYITQEWQTRGPRSFCGTA